MAASVLATSQDGKLYVAKEKDDPSGTVSLRQVGGLGATRRVLFNKEAYEAKTECALPLMFWLSHDNRLLAIVQKEEVVVFDLQQKAMKGDDGDDEPLPPAVTLLPGEEVVAAGFAAARSDDYLVMTRSESGTERMWNITALVQENARKLVY